MSLKADSFRYALPFPKTTEKFWVLIPNAPTSLLRVSATSLPYSSYSEEAIWLYGRAFNVPVAKESTGIWECTFEEDGLLTTAAEVSFLQSLVGNSQVKYQDIDIALSDQITGEVPHLLCTLKNAWLKEIAPVDLDWRDPTNVVKWKLRFRYNGIKRWF